jgi:hypothetical protein
MQKLIGILENAQEIVKVININFNTRWGNKIEIFKCNNRY